MRPVPEPGEAPFASEGTGGASDPPTIFVASPLVRVPDLGLGLTRGPLARKAGLVVVTSNETPQPVEANGFAARVATGIPGLDEMLDGGLLAGRAYLVNGAPGTGKTTLGLHFVRTGLVAGERTLVITLGEPEAQLRADARRSGIDLQGAAFLDLSPPPALFAETRTYDIFSPAEVERNPLTKQIVECVQAVNPRRIFLDALTQMRYLSIDPFQFRRQALSFLRFLVSQGATVVFTSEGSAAEPDDDLQFMADGVIAIVTDHAGRGLFVRKFRGSGFRQTRGGVRLDDRGMTVFPLLVPAVFSRAFVAEPLRSGVPELDAILHGGVERGTVTFISGPSGSGKTTVGLQFMKEAAGRGERSVVFTFVEEPEMMLTRAESLGIPARAMVANDRLKLIKVEPMLYGADEFAAMLRAEVEEGQASIVMIDSVSGFRQALRGEDMAGHLHRKCKYLQNMGVATLLVSEVESVSGEFNVSEVGVSYLADNVIMLRYVEVVDAHDRLAIAHAIGVLKKRLTSFERGLFALDFTPYGLRVGAPYTGLSTMLGKTPRVARQAI